MNITSRRFTVMILLSMLALSIAACDYLLPLPGGEELGTQLGITETFDQVRGEARLILTYNPTANAFEGSVSNTTSSTLTQVRVEVHLSNGAELGPTTPVDLAPGQSQPVHLTATAASFDGWTAHAEVGSGASGEHAGGSEGSESGESGLETLMSSPITPTSQTWSGNLGGLDVVGSYDASARSLTTVVTNTLPHTVCYVYTEPHLMLGGLTVGELGPGLVGDLNPGQSRTNVLYLRDEPSLVGVQFDGFKMHLEVFSCASPGPDGGAPTINPITGLPGGSEAGEGSNEGGTEGSGEHGGGSTGEYGSG